MRKPLMIEFVMLTGTSDPPQTTDTHATDAADAAAMPTATEMPATGAATAVASIKPS
jgi:hypothetical protein